MTGVEILSSETVYHAILPWGYGFISFIAVFIFTMLFAYSLVNGRTMLGSCFLCALVSSAIILILSLSSDKTNVDYIKYKVSIDDSVSMTEFIDKYEILEQEGKIYTVKEKE